MNKIWVLTYTIGTNEGRKQRRLTCDTKEFAEKQHAVLGGEIREYTESPQALTLRWPEKADLNGVIEKIREIQNDPNSWRDQFMTAPIVEPKHIDVDAVLSEVASIIDDMSTRAPFSPRELEPGSAGWDCYKLGKLNIIKQMLEPEI